MTLPLEYRDFAKRFVDEEAQILDAPPPPPGPRDLSPTTAWRMNEAAEEGRKKLTKVELLEIRRAYDPTEDTDASKADLIRDITQWVRRSKKE